jgi:predicted O-methyltransferase YrrM
MPERYLSVASFSSAAAVAIFLYFKSAILPRRAHRTVLGLLVFIAGTLVLPLYSVYSPAITLSWIALGLIAYLLTGAIWRAPLVFRQWWAVLDALSAASLLGATVYSITQIILAFPAEDRIRTLLASYLASAACVHLLHELDRATVLQRPSGLVLGQTLVLAASIPSIFGRHRIDFMVLLCFVVGIILIAWRLRFFFRTTEEHRVLEKMAVDGDVQQPEYTEPSLECPEPRLWSMYDPQTAEKEVLDLLYALVRALKPRLVVETGTFSGISSTYIARAMRENGLGQLITCEIDPLVHQNACGRFRAAGLSTIIDCRLGSSLDLKIDDQIDLLYCDSDLKARGVEVRRFLHNLNPFGLILMHDAGSRFKVVREAALQMESEGLISVVLVSTPRGLVIAQKKQGRI